MKQSAISAIRNLGHVGMAPLERRLLTACHSTQPPVFIVGAPRSGTSLLYELMITRFRFAYISNAAHRFYKTPLAASRIFKKAIENWHGDFSSRYGHIDGWGAPNEGGWVWLRWMQDGDWTDGLDFPVSAADQIRQMTQSLSSQFGAPFINKNVMHSNRLRLMNKIWSDALFIEVQRDTLDNARSIVRAERAEGGPKTQADQWWSVRPSIARQYAGKPDTVRAVAQVVGTSRDIAKDMRKIGSDRLLTVSYTDICANPEAALSQIDHFLSGGGCHLSGRFEVPKSFEVQPSRSLQSEDEIGIVKTIEAINSP